ncbi:isochorismatase family protein [Nocardia sp. NPDC058705]|uniref:isochorismatase family protein n=1 Tax=Nocardia sp. NPDC058705 TaxID=3346609 RepID=UPI003673976B
MTTLPDRPNTALLVVDVQNGVVDEAPLRNEVVANIAALVDRARIAQIPVIWIQHSSEDLVEGTEPWQYVPELTRADTEELVPKHYGDSFEDTALEDVLAAARAGHLVVTGAESDACIRSTIHGAFVRGYDVTLVADAHTAGDKTRWGAPKPEEVIAHTNLYWQFQQAPGRTAAVRPTGELDFTST